MTIQKITSDFDETKPNHRLRCGFCGRPIQGVVVRDRTNPVKGEILHKGKQTGWVFMNYAHCADKTGCAKREEETK